MWSLNAHLSFYYTVSSGFWILIRSNPKDGKSEQIHASDFSDQEKCYQSIEQSSESTRGDMDNADSLEHLMMTFFYASRPCFHDDLFILKTHAPLDVRVDWLNNLTRSHESRRSDLIYPCGLKKSLFLCFWQTSDHLFLSNVTSVHFSFRIQFTFNQKT